MSPTVTVPVHHREADLSVQLSLNSRVGSRKTTEKVLHSIELSLQFPRGVLRKENLRARTSDTGSETDSLDTYKDTSVQQFRDKAGVFLVDIPGAATLYVSSLKQDLANVTARVQRLENQVHVLRECTGNFALVLRRSIVDDAHTRLQQLPDGIGSRQEDEHWEDYIERLWTTKDADWIKSHGLSYAAMSLLNKGYGTPYDQGCKAAHNMRSLDSDQFATFYQEGLNEREKRVWKQLYDFVAHA